MPSHAGQVLSREQLYSAVWDEHSAFHVGESVKAHIKALRKKLTPAGKEYIKNEWGIGYRFSPDFHPGKFPIIHYTVSNGKKPVKKNGILDGLIKHAILPALQAPF